MSSIVAAKLSLGLTADCIDVSYEGGRLVQFKPAFGGGVVARIVSKTKPEMATARPGMFRVVKCDIKPEVERIRLEPASSVKYTGFTPVPSDFRPLGASRIILSIGRGGIRKRENIQKVLKLAEILGASVGGSRPIVDMNFLPRQQQVGLTGSAVSPDVYIAMGISGQDNHVVGIRYANRVIAVNTDRNAPIFRYSDYGIVMDMMEFVDSFIQFLSGGKQEKA
ncbi:electron transfer flavoprotein subunit alpha/FixB family protein [Thermogymnomonas acidicola]|uniref:electron transfer flavoprotein subunit alpha/FixB family protein n=1 Tax=Thermogymnomonas acidicola TaxID=399579 RepID=UPI0009463C6E|nr:electron transfer flavoprotein subunit alpha/FixB family protein [Thermogymnomonas acidicola]